MQYFVHDDTQSSCDVVYKRAYENVAPHLRHGRGRQCRGEGAGGGLGSGQDGTGTECDVGSVSAEWQCDESEHRDVRGNGDRRAQFDAVL